MIRGGGGVGGGGDLLSDSVGIRNGNKASVVNFRIEVVLGKISFSVEKCSPVPKIT